MISNCSSPCRSPDLAHKIWIFTETIDGYVFAAGHANPEAWTEFIGCGDEPNYRTQVESV